MYLSSLNKVHYYYYLLVKTAKAVVFQKGSFYQQFCLWSCIAGYNRLVHKSCLWAAGLLSRCCLMVLVGLKKACISNLLKTPPLFRHSLDVKDNKWASILVIMMEQTCLDQLDVRTWNAPALPGLGSHRTFTSSVQSQRLPQHISVIKVPVRTERVEVSI